MASLPDFDDDIRCDWNRPAHELPLETDVLVVGAGPAGSACAKVLADTGMRVVLIDHHRFPREKVCGDGLVPDTLAALDRLGLKHQVLSHARQVPVARCVAPSGRSIDVSGELAVLPREKLDALLCAHAVRTGVQMFAPVRYVAPLQDEHQRIVGAQLSDPDGPATAPRREIRARWTVLATGANTSPLTSTQTCQRKSPSAMALRAYVRHPTLAQQLNALRFVWHPNLKGGYGWIFPGPEGLLNIGVGILDSQEVSGKPSASRRKPPNLRQLFDEFVAQDEVARQLMQEGELQGGLKGAPLRCDLEGAAWSRPGLLVAGEGAGTTYAFTGEGIGKAMESGLAAAESLRFFMLKQMPLAAEDTAVQTHYTQQLEALRPRFALYRKAASFNRHPWLIELMIWRAQGSTRLLNRLADVLNERRMPGTLLSWRGLKALFRG